MNWAKRYANFIASRAEPCRSDGHRHHIIPRAWGGTDHPDNLVVLSVREHIHAHMLLSRLDPDQWFSVVKLYQSQRMRLPSWIRRQVHKQSMRNIMKAKKCRYKSIINKTK